MKCLNLFTQAVLLEHLPEEEGGEKRELWMLNTHLFGHPDATHVRLVQACTLMRQVSPTTLLSSS